MRRTARPQFLQGRAIAFRAQSASNTALQPPRRALRFNSVAIGIERILDSTLERTDLCPMVPRQAMRGRSGSSASLSVACLVAVPVAAPMLARAPFSTRTCIIDRPAKRLVGGFAAAAAASPMAVVALGPTAAMGSLTAAACQHALVAGSL